MEKRFPRKIYRNILNSLGGGTVPREGLGYIAVGREKELSSLLRDTEIIEDGGATFRFIVGDYGSGKTFLLQTIKEYAVKNDFIVAEVDLSPNRSLIGNSTKKKGLATYRELISNVSNKTHQSGKALTTVLDSWINNLFNLVALESVKNGSSITNMEELTVNLMYKQCEYIREMTYGFEFTQALKVFYEVSRMTDDGTKEIKREKILRWFRGDYNSIQESKRETGINAVINDDNWFDYIKIWAEFFKMAGYKGFLVLIDELINIYKSASSTTRQNNYEKILSMYNDTLQGRAQYLGIVMSGVPVSIYDKKKGVFSYEALRSRLSTGSYEDIGLINMMTPIVKVYPLTKEEMYVLLEKLTEIHTKIYDYNSTITEDDLLDFIKIAYVKRDSINITPRTMIRDYIQLLDVKKQNPNSSVKEILSAYKFSKDEEQSLDEFD